jgi:hypothetical protein
MNNPYSIEARSYDIASIASHNFWVLRNSKGETVSELHGLATDRETNKFKPIGIFNDRLGFYEFKRLAKDTTFISSQQRLITVYQGDKEDVMKRWNNAACQVSTLNEKDVNYSPFGIFGFPITNSNSAFHLFSHFMGFECCHFSGVFQPGIRNPLFYCHH